MSMFTIELDWPELGPADLAGNFRRDVGGVLEQGIRDIVSSASGATPYPRIADAYDVNVQEGEDGLAIEVLNTASHFWFVEEDTRPHFIPPHPVPLGAIMGWAQERGLNPYAVQWSIEHEGVQHPGTTGKHFFGQAWDAGIESVLGDTADAFEEWASMWGGA